MPDIEWNKTKWGNFHWGLKGDEWSRDYGGPTVQWSATLYPRVAPFLPAGSILEIAPGYGRWTEFLLPYCDSLVAYDLNDNCIRSCKERFADEIAKGKASFHTNDGLTLSSTPDSSIDFVFSYDSLVHVEQDVVASYLEETMRVLKPGGYAFLHHSNLANYGKSWLEGSLGRGVTVGAFTVQAAAAKVGLKVIVQEMISWQSFGLRDCITLVRKTDDAMTPVMLADDRFWMEAQRLRDSIGAWHRVTAPAPAELGLPGSDGQPRRLTT